MERSKATFSCSRKSALRSLSEHLARELDFMIANHPEKTGRLTSEMESRYARYQDLKGCFMRALSRATASPTEDDSGEARFQGAATAAGASPIARASGKSPGTVTGTGIVYDKICELVEGEISEVICSGACRDAVRGDEAARITSAFNHDEEGAMLGRVSSGTLRLSETSDGVQFEVDLPGDFVGERVAGLIRRGDITGASFVFSHIKDDWEFLPLTRTALRRIRSIGRVYEIGPVARPAYAQTHVGLAERSAARPRSAGKSRRWPCPVGFDAEVWTDFENNLAAIPY